MIKKENFKIFYFAKWLLLYISEHQFIRLYFRNRRFENVNFQAAMQDRLLIFCENFLFKWTVIHTIYLVRWSRLQKYIYDHTCFMILSLFFYVINLQFLREKIRKGRKLIIIKSRQGIDIRITYYRILLKTYNIYILYVL